MTELGHKCKDSVSLAEIRKRLEILLAAYSAKAAPMLADDYGEFTTGSDSEDGEMLAWCEFVDDLSLILNNQDPLTGYEHED